MYNYNRIVFIRQALLYKLMKNTLEYKILKYLFKNGNTDFVDISHLSSDRKVLDRKIFDLKKQNYIDTQPYPPKNLTGKGYIDFSSGKSDKCLIKSKGIEYLKDYTEKPFTKYQIVYLIGFFYFWWVICFPRVFKNISLKSKSDSLNIENESLKDQNSIYKDSIITLKKENELYKIKDTIKVNKYE